MSRMDVFKLGIREWPEAYRGFNDAIEGKGPRFPQRSIYMAGYERGRAAKASERSRRRPHTRDQYLC